MLASLPYDAIIVRVLATALVIVTVTWSVELLGPLVGGVLAGLPITLGPGFYFLVGQTSPSFIAQAAIYAILSLCATQCFLLAYIVAARHWRPLGCMMAALLAWGVVAYLIHRFSVGLWASVAVFLGVSGLCMVVGRQALYSLSVKGGKTGLPSLFLRGVLAGFLVAAVTTASHWLGPEVSGLLLSFPIGYLVISVTLHQQMGRVVTMTTLYSAIFGTLSLTGFCAALAWAAPHQPPYSALGMALLASLLVTSALVIWRRLG